MILYANNNNNKPGRLNHFVLLLSHDQCPLFSTSLLTTALLLLFCFLGFCNRSSVPCAVTTSTVDPATITTNFICFPICAHSGQHR
mmetsp:Transcript_2126/g.3177  ORF Transcript_2126/g.3177 Transcript_2126/m.3177 type:complete len:86 (+) Transcript_2126:86-343(+)